MPKVVLKRRQTQLVPVIMHRDTLNPDGTGGNVITGFAKLPALTRHTTKDGLKTDEEQPKPGYNPVVSGMTQAFKEKLKNARATKNYMAVTPTYVEGKIFEI